MADLDPSSNVPSRALSLPDRARLARQLAAARFDEYLKFDSHLAALAGAWGSLSLAALFAMTGRNLRALSSLMAAHRINSSRTVQKVAEHVLRQSAVPNSSLGRRVNDAYDQFLASVPMALKHEQASNLVGTRLLVVKSPAENERGVIIIDYTHTFPIFALCCDLATLARKYYLVLEPSWVGYCNPEILEYSRLQQPVFVQTNEFPDAEVLQRVSANLIPVPIVANWWIDHRLIKPAAGVRKEFDISMVASWTVFKRHAALFAALRRLRRRGIKLTTLLIGYPLSSRGLTRDDIYRQAQYFGVADQIHIRESIPPGEVATELSRSKVHVVWSRREGSNRAVIESMLAGVPGILREGFNFGQHYPYINPQTGRFANESTLPDSLLYMTEHHSEFNPREWILNHMTPQIATQIMNDRIKRVALANGEAWTKDAVVKVAQLHEAGYWDPADAPRFADDYAYVRSLLRTPS